MNEPLICAAQLCNYHVMHFDDGIDAEKEPPPPAVQRVLAQIVSHAGMQRVQKVAHMRQQTQGIDSFNRM